MQSATAKCTAQPPDARTTQYQPSRAQIRTIAKGGIAVERPIDYMSVLRQEVDALVAKWASEHGRAPRAIVFPFAKYALLEDYCRDRDIQALLQAITAVAQADPEQRTQRLQERAHAQRRLDQLRQNGVEHFTSNAGDLRITVDRSATQFRFL